MQLDSIPQFALGDRISSIEPGAPVSTTVYESVTARIVDALQKGVVPVAQDPGTPCRPFPVAS